MSSCFEGDSTIIRKCVAKNKRNIGLAAEKKPNRMPTWAAWKNVQFGTIQIRACHYRDINISEAMYTHYICITPSGQCSGLFCRTVYHLVLDQCMMRTKQNAYLLELKESQSRLGKMEIHSTRFSSNKMTYVNDTSSYTFSEYNVVD